MTIIARRLLGRFKLNSSVYVSEHQLIRHYISLSLILLFCIVLFFILFLWDSVVPTEKIIQFGYAVTLFLAWLFNRSGRFTMAIRLFLIGTWLITLIRIGIDQGIGSNYFINFSLIAWFAIFLLPKREWIIGTVLTVLFTFVIAIFEQIGRLPLYTPTTFPLLQYGIQLSRFIFIIVCCFYAQQYLQRKNAALRASEERYHYMFNASPYPILIFDIKTESFLIWNEEAAQVLGYTSEEKGSKAPSGHLCKKVLELSDAEWQELMTNTVAGKKYRTECRVLVPGRSPIFCQVTTTLLPDPTQQLLLLSLFDLTERRSAEQKLRKQAEIIDKVSEAIIIIDLDSKVTDWNQGAAQIYGWRKEEVIGKPFRELVPTTYPYDSAEQVFVKFSSNDFWQGVAVQIGRDGREIHVSASVTMLRDQAGVAQEVIAVNRDLKGMVNMELALKRAENWLAQLAETMDDVFWFTSLDGSQFYYVSDGYQRLTGYHPSELKEKKLGLWLPIVDSADYSRCLQCFNELCHQLSEGEEKEMVYRIVTKTQELRWILCRARVIVDEHTRQPTLMGISVDITPQKKLEEQLQTTQAQLQLIINNIPATIAYINKEEQFVFVSEQAQRLGVNLEEVVGQPLTAISAQLYQSQIVHLRKALHGEFVATEREYALPKSGFNGILQINYVPHFVDGHVEGVFAMVLDVTHQRKTELSLQRAQKTESLGLLASGVAHDLNNLLVPMITQTSLALRKLDAAHPSYNHIAKANAVAIRAATLTKQVLAYSGRGQFEIKQIDVNQFIRDNYDLLRISVPSHVQIIPSYGENLSPIRVDIAQFQQILMNLVINAGQAIEKREGLITIKTSCYTLSAEDDRFSTYLHSRLPAGDYLLLEIEDNGKGIPPQIVERIFDPFFTTKSEGNGLGLSAVLGIMRGHEGGIDLVSVPHKGTQFRLLFPFSSV